MPSTAFSWQSFLTRMKDVDPDLRQMALFDLEQELKKDSFIMSEDDQTRALDKILVCFGKDEKHSDVHSNAVRLLSAIVPKLSDAKRARLAAEMVKIMVGPQPSEVNAEQQRQMRENACLGLKAISEALGAGDVKAASELVGPLTAALKKDDEKIRMDIYDVVSDVLVRFGHAQQIQEMHAALQAAVLVDFEKGSNPLRKKAVNCLAVVCQSSSDELFAAVMQSTINGLTTNKGEKLRRYIQLCNSISRAAASRFGGAVEKVVPCFFRELDRLDTLDDELREGVDADEVRENILQALGSFVARCTTFVGPLLHDIVSRCAQLLKWDPNYCDDEGADAEVDDDDELEEFDDDTDISWKVRKAAARCLVEAIRARPDQLNMFVAALVSDANPILPARFRERIENVRIETLGVFQAILEACKVTIPAEMREGGSFSMSAAFAGGSFRTVIESRAEVQGLLPIKQTIVKALLSCLRHKAPKVKQVTFCVLRDFFILVGPELSTTIPECFDAAIASLRDPKLALPQLRPEVLSFVRLLTNITVRLVSTDDSYEQLITHVERVFDVVFDCTEDRFFKTVVAALQVCGELVAAVRMSPNQEALSQRLFACVQARLATGDADQEVKRAAVETMSRILRFLEGSLVSVAAEVVKVHEQLLVLLKSDTTRLAASSAIHAIVNCDIQPSIVKQYAAELTTLLRKNDRQVRESGLRTLMSLVPKHGKDIEATTLRAIISELTNESTALINHKELFLASLGLQLGQRLVALPGVANDVLEKLVPCTLKLLTSQLVQGQPVKDAVELFRVIGSSPDVPFASLLAKTIAAAKEATPASIGNVAVAIGTVVTMDSDAARREKSIAHFVALVGSGSEEQAIIGLTCLGHIGRLCDLHANAAAEQAILASLSSAREEIKAAASTALGRAASSLQGEVLLTDLLARVHKAPAAERYFLLRALKEAIITATAETQMQSPLRGTGLRAQILSLLLEFGGSSEEGIAEVSSECLGRFALIDPVDIVPKCAAATATVNDTARATLISAMKYAVTGMTKAKGADTQVLEAHLPTFLAFLTKSQPLVVRRAAMQLLSCIAFSHSQLLPRASINPCIEALLAELPVDMSLVKEVDLGPFKHRVDSGLDTRKVAFECLSVLIDGMARPHSILDAFGNAEQLVAALTSALYTPEVEVDINNLARTMLVRLSRLHAGAVAVIANMDAICKSLVSAFEAKIKDGQEAEKVAEGQKYALVCLISLRALPGGAQHPAISAAMTKAQAHKQFAAAAAIAAE